MLRGSRVSRGGGSSPRQPPPLLSPALVVRDLEDSPDLFLQVCSAEMKMAAPSQGQALNKRSMTGCTWE